MTQEQTQKPKSGGFLKMLLINTISIFAAAYLIPGVNVDGLLTALVVALVMSFLNAIIKPILIIITLPITFVTLGFFLLVINVLMLYMADALVSGFSIAGFWWALLFSIVVSLINGLLNSN